jgi:hypothetical protein
MLTKEKILATLDGMPDEFSLETLLEKLILLEKIELGLEQVEANQVHSQEEIQQKFAR